MDETLRNLALTLSGLLAILAAITHTVLGETKVFARVQITPNGARRIIHAVWLFGVVSWVAIAVLVIAAPHLGSPDARHWIVAASTVTYGFGALGNAIGTRGKHFGWIVMLVVAALSIAGW
jgi:hypothetical protein